MDNETIANWARDNMNWLEQRQAEMNSVELNDPLFVMLRDMLNVQGVAMHETLAKAVRLASV